jgi:nucleoid-associated protein YgaU
MTKETKIGLLVGCFVIILIGILISDHLANVQNQEPARIAEAVVPSESDSPLSIYPDSGSEMSYAVDDSSPPLPLPEELIEPEPVVMVSDPEPELQITPYELNQDLPRPAIIGTQNGDSAGSTSTLETSEGVSPDETHPGLFEAVDGVAMPNEVAQNGQPNGRPQSGFPGQGGGLRGERGGYGRGPRTGGLNGDGARGGFRPGGGDRSQFNNANGSAGQNPRPGVRFGAEGNRLNQPQPGNSAISNVGAASPRPAQPIAKVTYHTVKEGETLSDISSQYYNTSKHYQLIYNANKQRIPNVNSVRHGVRIVIPSLPGAQQATQQPVAAQNPIPSTPATHAPQAPVANRPASVKTYVIQESDTLSSIAKKYYGSSKAWYKLYQLNKDRISNPDRVKPGMEINVPVQ